MADSTDKVADKKMCLVKNFVFEITDKAEMEMVHVARMSNLLVGVDEHASARAATAAAVGAE